MASRWYGLLACLVTAAYCSADFVCPVPASYIETQRSEPECSVDYDCNAGELCCIGFASRHCLSGINNASKTGLCPAKAEQESSTNCMMDHMGCHYDSQCDGEMKCCKVDGCYYRDCTEPVSVIPPAPPQLDLACPQSVIYDSYYTNDAAEPSCQNDYECAEGEKCCYWESIKQCKTGLVTAPKIGSCPVTESPEGFINCQADYVGCLYDSQCSGNGKCCRVNGCYYNECAEPAFVIPPAPPQLDLACPQSVIYDSYYTNDAAEPSCQNDYECAEGEKCCYWGNIMQCKTGLVTAPKIGSCPVTESREGFINCQADYVGCLYDSQCNGNGKCCRVNGCYYSECAEPASVTPVAAPPQHPKMCTRRGCASQARPDCKEVKIVLPNGEGCEPRCRICMDPPPTPPKACTEIGCGPKPDQSCMKIKRVRPNGKGCGPVCDVCADEPKELSCPRYVSELVPEQSDTVCESDKDCEVDEKCCSWGDDNQCKKGLDTTPKAGTCSASTLESCQTNFNRCQWDSECYGTEKCCFNRNCGYKECKAAIRPSKCIWIREKICHQTKLRPDGSPRCKGVRKIVCET